MSNNAEQNDLPILVIIFSITALAILWTHGMTGGLWRLASGALVLADVWAIRSLARQRAATTTRRR